MYIYTGVLISPQSDQEGNKLQRQKILIFIYPIYNRNWRNISTIYTLQRQKILMSIYPIYNRNWRNISTIYILQRQKILMFIYPIYNHNWRNISNIYINKTRLASNEKFSLSNKIHREVGLAKDLSAPRYYLIRPVIATSRAVYDTFQSLLL